MRARVSGLDTIRDVRRFRRDNAIEVKIRLEPWQGARLPIAPARTGVGSQHRRRIMSVPPASNSDVCVLNATQLASMG